MPKVQKKVKHYYGDPIYGDRKVVQNIIKRETTKQISLTSWNMQRRAKGTYEAALEYLCENSEILYIQETPLSFRTLDGWKQHNHYATLTRDCGTFYRNTQSDGQDPSMGCFNMIFVNAGSAFHCSGREAFKVKSGAANSERYPTAIKGNLGCFDLILVSYHATSGGGAGENADNFLQVCDDKQESGDSPIILAGGDFNTAQSKMGGPSLHAAGFPTQSKGAAKGLDAFYLSAEDEEGFSMSKSTVATVSNFSLVLQNPTKGEDWNKINAGCIFSKGGIDTKVSDHIPISTTVTLKRKYVVVED